MSNPSTSISSNRASACKAKSSDLSLTKATTQKSSEEECQATHYGNFTLTKYPSENSLNTINNFTKKINTQPIKSIKKDTCFKLKHQYNKFECKQ